MLLHPYTLKSVKIGGALSFAALGVLLLAAAGRAQAQTETVLYNFTGSTDGASPQYRLTSDGAGNLYGTTYQGGLEAGTVFELSPNGGGGWSEVVLHSFNGGLNIGQDGAGPSGPVIFDGVGNIYGTTRFGGTDYLYCSYGTVFELSPVGATWQENILLSECPSGTGIFPANAFMDQAGNLYGTTAANGPLAGTVFELSPSGGGWTVMEIYNTGADTPTGLTMDIAGNIFFTTASTVVELMPNGKGGWNPTPVHVFAGYPYDGYGAGGTPLFDKAGSLYGTTNSGGAANRGTVYKLTPGANGIWKEEILYSFHGAKDGSSPTAGVAFDATGNIYGTTETGGNDNKGTVFELATTGSSHYEFALLWSFSGPDGEYPLGSLILDRASNLYGTTSLGGASNAGVVFEVSGVRTTPVTTLSSSLNPSIYGQTVTFTVAVTNGSSESPTGNVTFISSGNILGTTTLNNGIATLIKSNLSAGRYALTAQYKGDSNNLGSWSPVLNQIIQQATTTAMLTSSLNPSTQGQAVTFTATISSPTVRPTGPVTFTAGKTVLGTAQLVGGKAKLTISFLSIGSTRVTATYYGNSNIAKSSASVTQTVQ